MTTIEERNKAAARFKVGDEIKIVRMVDEPQYDGKGGRITKIDSWGQLHGTWGGLAVQPFRDNVEILKPEGGAE